MKSCGEGSNACGKGPTQAFVGVTGDITITETQTKELETRRSTEDKIQRFDLESKSVTVSIPSFAAPVALDPSIVQSNFF